MAAQDFVILIDKYQNPDDQSKYQCQFHCAFTIPIYGECQSLFDIF